MLTRVLMRAITVATIAFSLLLAESGPALAHAKAEIDNPQGGATNVTLSVTADAESDSAGITSVRVVLPAGIVPADVSFARGPNGWSLAPGADGFTVGGPALGVKTDGDFAVKLAQLPPAGGTLVFKMLVNYSDGQVDRWIQEPGNSGSELEQPAPTVQVLPAAATTTSGASSSTPSTSTTQASGPTQPDPTKSDNDNSAFWVIPAVAVAAAVVAVILFRRRSR